MKRLLAWAWRQSFVRFALVGGAGYLVNAAALTILTRTLYLDAAPALAGAIKSFDGVVDVRLN